MSIVAFPARLRPHAGGLALLLAGLIGLAVMLWPEPARANIVCSMDGQSSIAFGSSSTATGTVRYTCRSFNTTPASFTMCIGIGNPSYPGTVQQPQMQSGANALNFNLYTDAATTNVWTTTSPITQPVTLAAGGVVSGTFTFYGRIPAGQPSPVGSYQAYFFNTVLGFLASGAQSCATNVNDLNGLDFTLFVTGSVADACNLGTIQAIDFGTQTGFWTQADAAGAVQVICPANTSWTLTFDGGLHASGDERRMASASGDQVPYRLYRDSGRTDALAIGGAISGVGTGAVQTSPVYGRVSVAQPPPTGEYADAVIVVLRF
jgi:spore coat protein U-like protein